MLEAFLNELKDEFKVDVKLFMPRNLEEAMEQAKKSRRRIRLKTQPDDNPNR